MGFYEKLYRKSAFKLFTSINKCLQSRNGFYAEVFNEARTVKGWENYSWDHEAQPASF